MARRKVTVGETRVCSPDYGVTTLVVESKGAHVHRRGPCVECPWRMDVPTGVFPPDAFRESARTAYDGAMSTFSCHMSGASSPATCAGFLLRHSEHNIGVRIAAIRERIDVTTVGDGGIPVYRDYRDMAVANGVPADDPSLEQVRADGDRWDRDLKRWVRPDDTGV